MMRLALLMLSLVPGSAFAQMSQERLLSGTTLGLPWGLYSGPASRLQKDQARLQLSAPSGARVLGTKYDAGTQTALLSYRDDLNARHALDVAVDQLQRQGFELTFRSWAAEGRAQALLRRNDRLLEVRIIQGAERVTQALYRFRDGNLPERLMVSQLPSYLEVYAAPVDLKTVQAERGRLLLTPPADVPVDLTSYRNGVVSLQFYGDFSLSQLRAFYLPFFISQGFIEIGDTREGANEATYRFARGDERLTVELQARRSTNRARVDLQFQR